MPDEDDTDSSEEGESEKTFEITEREDDEIERAVRKNSECWLLRIREIVFYSDVLRRKNDAFVKNRTLAADRSDSAKNR